MCEKFLNFLYQLAFTVAVVMFSVAIIDWVMRLFGYTLSFLPYDPWRMFEFAAVILIFVIVVLLRQIRNAVSK